MFGRGRHDEVVKFIADLRTKVLIQGKRVRIDFSHTKKMVSCGTLLFFAELRRIKSLVQDATMLSCKRPKDQTVIEVLQHLEILDMLGTRSGSKPSRQDVVTWQVACGDQTDAQEIGMILEGLRDVSKLPEAVAKRLYTSITEALTNVTQHAYIKSRKDGVSQQLDKGWWMFFRETKDRLDIAVCDLGIGISETLPMTQTEFLIDPLFRAAQLIGLRGKDNIDARLIKAALEFKRSRTGQDHRGKGLPQIVSTAEEVDGSRLYIFSNAGCYTIGSDRHPPDFTRGYKRSILGTLILWSLPIDGWMEAVT